MADEILIFGSVGTQVVIGRKIFELVAIGGQGSVTWRSRCVVCRAPVFAEIRDGKLPHRARCNAHLMAARYPEIPEPDYQHEAELREMSQARPMAMIKLEEFMATVRSDMQRVSAIEQGIEIVGRARSASESIPQAITVNVEPLPSFIKKHMGDPDDTTVETVLGAEHTGGPLVLDHEEFSAESMLEELEQLAPEGADDPPAPPDDEAIWMPRLQMFYRDKMWSPSWNARPDQPGCEAPPELLARFRRG